MLPYDLRKIISLSKNGTLPPRARMTATPKKRDHHKEWLRTKSKIEVRRGFLIIKMGGKCRKCGSIENLELDHPEGKTWEAMAFSPQMRMKQYEIDYENGKLSLLCKACNTKDGSLNKGYYSAIRHGEEPEVEKVPF